jgi:hypothetical protein
MGIIVADELDLMNNGVIVTNCYVNIADFKYVIAACKQIFVNKLMRTKQNRNVISTERISITSNVLTNIEDQLYTALKTEYTSYTDDL